MTAPPDPPSDSASDREDEELEREVAELRRSYRGEVPAKAAAIGAAITERDRAAALGLAHRLRGTAGSYGLAEISAAAGAIEDALSAETPDWTTVDALMTSLTAAVGR